MVHRHCGTARQRVLYRGPYDWYRSWVDPRRDAAFQKLLVEEEIDVVHFVHFLYNSLGYVEVARSLGRPTVLGLYDYFIACPQFNLLDTSGQFCNLPGAEACDRCLGRMDGLPAGAQARRRELLSRVCATADRIHFLCHSQRAAIERVLPIPEDRAFVQGLGIRAAGGPQPAPPRRRPCRSPCWGTSPTTRARRRSSRSSGGCLSKASASASPATSKRSTARNWRPCPAAPSNCWAPTSRSKWGACFAAATRPSSLRPGRKPSCSRSPRPSAPASCP